MAFDVHEGLLGDAPQLPLLQEREADVLVGVDLDGEIAALGDPVGEAPRARRPAASLVGDVGPQVVEGVADLADHAPHVVAQLVEGRPEVVAPLVGLDDPVELEGQVGQGLADAVVQVPGDAGAFLVGADGAETGEPAGVVDGQGGRFDEAAEQLDVALVEVLRRRGARSRPGRRSRPGPAAGRRGRCPWSGHEPGAAGRGAGRCGRRPRRSPSTSRAAAGRSSWAMTSGQAGPVAARRPAIGARCRRAAGSRAASKSRRSRKRLNGGVEHLVQVEGGRQGLGDAVQ